MVISMAGTEDRFEDAEEQAGENQGAKALGGAVQEHDDGPEEDGDGDELAEGQALHQPGAGELGDDVAVLSLLSRGKGMRKLQLCVMLTGVEDCVEVVVLRISCVRLVQDPE
jgi:hypothetical protein